MNELVPLEERNVALMSDYDRQRDLFRRFGLQTDGFLMANNAIVEVPEGGYKLVKREHPVQWDVDVDGHARCISMMQRTEAEKVGIGSLVEEHPDPVTARRLVENALAQCSVEVGEVDAWGTL